jgi:hypothetical protein
MIEFQARLPKDEAASLLAAMTQLLWATLYSAELCAAREQKRVGPRYHAPAEIQSSK